MPETNFPPLDLPQVAQSLDFTCGAACFDSMYTYFLKTSLGELYFAKELKTLELGFTPLENIVDLANSYSFIAELKDNATLDDLKQALDRKNVIFVTWWDEDAGHYSLIKSITNEQIRLMDPWTARLSQDNLLALEKFLYLWKLRGARMITVQNILTAS